MEVVVIGSANTAVRVTAFKLKTAAVVYYKTDMDTCH